MKGRKALIWPLGNILVSSNVSSPLWGEFILFVPQDHVKVFLPFLSKIVTSKWRFYKASCWREKKGLWSVLGSHWFGWQAWLSVPHWRGILADAVGWLTQTQPPSNPRSLTCLYYRSCESWNSLWTKWYTSSQWDTGRRPLRVGAPSVSLPE